MLRPEAIGRVQTQLSESQRTREPRAASPGTGSPDRLYRSIIPFLPQPPVKWPSPCLGLGVRALCAVWMLWPSILRSEGLGPCS